MPFSLSIILCATGLAYIIRQRIKRVRKFQLDSSTEFADVQELPDDLVCVLRSDGGCCMNFPDMASK